MDILIRLIQRSTEITVQPKGGSVDNLTLPEGLRIGKSEIDGKGLFATKDFKKGEKVASPAATGEDDGFGGKKFEETDAARYTNHSANPNLKMTMNGAGHLVFVADKDISEGDELTVDYRTTHQVLPAPFSLWYRGRPYSGESSSGAGRVKFASETKQAFFGALTDLATNIVKNPLIGHVSSREGLTYAPGQGALVDRLDAMKNEQQAFKATETAAGGDRGNMSQLLTGVTNAAGGNPHSATMKRLIDRFGRDAEVLAPYVRLLAPETWEKLQGWRGSASNLAASLHQTALGQRDPVTGQRGALAAQAGDQANALYSRLYGPNANRAWTAGYSAKDLGDIDAAARSKGLLSSPTPLTDDTYAKRLSSLAQTTSAARDMLNVHKEAAVHSLVGRKFVGGQEYVTCPHCDQKLKPSDLYMDAKGWLFHRACLRKGKGPIKLHMEEKKSVDARGLLDLVDKLTQGQSANMTPQMVASYVRQLSEIAKTTPGGLDRIFSLVAHGGNTAESAGLERVLATRTAPSAATFGSSFNQMAGQQGYNGLTPDEATDLDTRLRTSAAASPMANMMAATIAMDDSGLLRPGTAGAQAAQAFRSGYAGQGNYNIGFMDPHSWASMMGASGVSPAAAWEQLRARDANREYVHKYNLADVARASQGEVETRPILRNYLGQGMVPTLSTAGLPLGAAMAPVAAQLEHHLHNLPAELLTGDRKQLVATLAGQLSQSSPGLAAQLGQPAMHEMVHSALNSTDQMIRSDSRLQPYKNLIGMMSAHRPDILRAGTAASLDAAREGQLRANTAYLGQDNALQRLTDSARQATPGTRFTEHIAKGLGAVPSEGIQQAVNLPSVSPSALLGPNTDAANQAWEQRTEPLQQPNQEFTPQSRVPKAPFAPGSRPGVH